MKCLTHTEIETTLNVPEEQVPEAWEQHLASCASCRRQMEAAVGSAEEWDLARRTLSDSSAEIESAPTSVEKYESTIFYRCDLDTPESHDKVEPSVSSSQVELLAPSHPENLGRLGRYEIERVVGRGGMGIVFKGFDAELNRPVAIKILSPHLSDHGTARQRFTREAKAAAAVVHDNVVPIFDIQSDTKQPYLVMPYVNGVSLEDYVESEGQIETHNILQVAFQIASGLSAAHAQGLIHRDIKPGNILLENGLNRVLITDFGLARAVDDAAMTHSGMIAGTPHYMSPEQAKGEPMDHRSDLFSLGCVMYFMATGRTLHRGEGPYSIIAQLCQSDYRPIREINPNIPAFVADVIDKLLEKEPQHRFQTAQQLAHHLEQSLAHLQHPTVQKAPRRIWSSRKKKAVGRYTISIGLVVAVLAFVTLGLPMIFGENSSQSNNSPSLETTLPTKKLVPLSDWQNELSVVERELDALEVGLIGSGLETGNLDQPLDAELLELEQQLVPLSTQLPAGKSAGNSSNFPGFSGSQPIEPNGSRRPTNLPAQSTLQNKSFQKQDDGLILDPNHSNPSKGNED